jgi:hypothetical protein
MSLPAIDPEAAVSGAHERSQQMRKLFAQRSHVVPLGFEQLQQRAQMRRRERGAAEVVRVKAVDKVMHAATEVLRVRVADVRLMVQTISRRVLPVNG